MAEQLKHSRAMYASYMVKAIKLLFDTTELQNQAKSEEKQVIAVRLDQPLETLAKMAKAQQAIDSCDEPDYGTEENLQNGTDNKTSTTSTSTAEWLRIDCNLC